MPVKIIKRGTEQAAMAKRYGFGEAVQHCDPTHDIVPEWMQRPSLKSVPEQAEEPLPSNAAEDSGLQSTSAQDIAQIEKSAYEDGFRQGEKAGMSIAENKVEASMRRYAEAMLELANLRGKIYRKVEREVVKLALEVAKKIVHREVRADQQIILTLVKVALSNVAEKSAVTIHLNPSDYVYLLEHRDELHSEDDGGRETVLLADKSIDRGGCLIQTECGDIDARIEQEFRELERGFFEGLTSGER